MNGVSPLGQLPRVLGPPAESGTPVRRPGAEAHENAAPEATRNDRPFAQVLREVLEPVSSSKAEADQALKRLLTGENEDLHDVQVAVMRAELNFQLLLQLRNKVVTAYQEIMQMPV